MESEKIFHLKYWKSAKNKGSLKIFQNLGPHLTTPEWASSNVSTSGNMKHTWNTMQKAIFKTISRALVQYGGTENRIKWKNKSFLSFSWLTFNTYMST